jgi:hypothetical protein
MYGWVSHFWARKLRPPDGEATTDRDVDGIYGATCLNRNRRRDFDSKVRQSVGIRGDSSNEFHGAGASPAVAI